MKDINQLGEKYGPKTISQFVIVCASFAQTLSLPPGGVASLLAKAEPEDLANAKTVRQAMALVMKQFAKKLDDALVKAESQQGEGPELDLTCAKDVFEAANPEHAESDVNHASHDPLIYMPGNGTIN